MTRHLPALLPGAKPLLGGSEAAQAGNPGRPSRGSVSISITIPQRASIDIPLVGQLATEGSGLKLLVGYDRLVLVRPAEPRIDVGGQRSGEILTLRNSGKCQRRTGQRRRYSLAAVGAAADRIDQILGIS